MKRGAPLPRRTPLRARSPLPRNGKALKRQPMAPCSPAQREKVADRPCLACGERPCDPAHIAARGGPAPGCDSSWCVIPLCRSCHRAFDGGGLDVMPDLIAQGCVSEIQHALGHYRGDLIALLHRVTGERWEAVGV